MNLNELADALSVPHGATIHWKYIDEAAALLRAAAAETVGTEWPENNRIAVTLEKMHNDEIAAVRLAVAAARKERDEAVSEAFKTAAEYIAADNKNAALQRAIDEAMAVLDTDKVFSGSTADRARSILRPHATRREEAKAATVAENATPAIQRAIEMITGEAIEQLYSTPRGTPEGAFKRILEIASAVTPTRQEEPKATAEQAKQAPTRQWSSTPPSDHSGKWWHSWLVGGVRRWGLVPDRVRWTYAMERFDGDLWLPYLPGDTRDTLPPLPTIVGNFITTEELQRCGSVVTLPTETQKGSPVPTRELVARLAEVVRDVSTYLCQREACDTIIRDAKGGAE